METAPEKPVRRTWLLTAFGLLAVAVAYVALSPLARDWFEKTAIADRDAELRADVEEIFAYFKTYQTLKELYPQAYEQLIDLTINDIRAGKDNQQILLDAAEFTTRLRRENAQYFAMASVERLRLSLNAQIPQYIYLKNAYGFKACNVLAVNGGVAITRLLGADLLKDGTLTKLTDEATGYFFRTTAEGRELKLQHQKPSAADWRIAGDYLRGKGLTDADLALIDAPRTHLDDARLCDAAIKFYEGITTMDNDAARRIVPYLAAASASG